jgi:hypothetical protein
MNRVHLLFCLFVSFLFANTTIHAQSTAYILKGGATGGSQTWENAPRNNNLLLRYHGAIAVETHDNLEDKFAAFLQLGYHVKGSALRFRGGVDLNGNVFGPQTNALEFRNISMILGGKRKYDIGEYDKWYYSLGIRGDYTASYTLDFFPGFSDGVRRWNFGISLGGGYQWNISEHIGLIFEANVHPDFSRQIFLPPARYINFFTGELETWPEISIRNVAFEISIGIRFLNKVEYID